MRNKILRKCGIDYAHFSSEKYLKVRKIILWNRICGKKFKFKYKYCGKVFCGKCGIFFRYVKLNINEKNFKQKKFTISAKYFSAIFIFKFYSANYLSQF